jgi:nitric oxide synthase-interacting protein
MANLGSLTERLGADSQLKFGYCPLSLNQVHEGVVTPSGHIYEREVILEYLLNKTREIKEQLQEFEIQRDRFAAEEKQKGKIEEDNERQNFNDSQSIITTSREATRVPDCNSRKRVIDDTSREEQMAKFKQVSPWIVQFTPSYDREVKVKEPPKRPPSPFSRNPLRLKDLIPVNLVRESSGSDKFICPVSR